ncbi:ATP synthase F0 sector subunit b [Enhygromyxa salina]|uniref:ATP synthase subunit b n=1 Tax=Enhygromyxa salina TaxID=215803 RepID=A0A0C2CM39_9BACT|nr:ATP synthase F0 subunit B [Enhygromyxa salina]KIG12306.1 ATP synthase F0 sector subunit b [Enhygromyxa salina]
MTNTALLVASESLPVVDIDNTIFLQAILFLLLFVVLNSLLFKPWLEVKARRAQQIGGALADATQLRTQAEQSGQEYEQRLAKARDEAMELRSDRRREAELEEAKIVGAARAEANQALDARKQALAQQTEQARGELGGQVSSLANEIAQQILGRSA